MARERALFLFLLVVFLACAVLPASDRHKDGPVHLFSRFACFCWVLSVFRARALAEAPESFYERYVGPASPKSLAVLRVAAALILLVFTSDMVTAPLSVTSEAPRWTCRPTGLLRIATTLSPALSTGIEDPEFLGFLQIATRCSLCMVIVGLGGRLVTLIAAGLWLLSGGIYHSYNVWRGHSFISSWWCLLILATRGGAHDALAVDAVFKTLLRGTVTLDEPQQRAARGWTRWLITAVLANNYFMAGLTKLCASGVLWASGENLKSKLLASTLDRTLWAWAGHVSLVFRWIPTPLWSFLGIAGLFGEIAMGLVPFWPPAAALFPAVMWSMHVGIIFLQHITFVDLLTAIPFWYVRPRRTPPRTSRVVAAPATRLRGLAAT